MATASSNRDEAGRLPAATFHGIASISTDAIITVDSEQLITFFNEGAERIFGYAADEVVGRPLEILLPERLREAHHRHVTDFGDAPVAARRMGERSEISGLRKSGETFPAEASITKLDVDGERIYSVVLRDITARRRSERAQALLARAGGVLASSLEYGETLKAVARLAVSGPGDWCVVYIRDGEDGSVRRAGMAHADEDGADLLAALERYPLDPARPHPALSVVETGQPELLEKVPPALAGAIAEDDEHRRILEELGLGSMVIAPLVARGRTFGAIALVRAGDGRGFDGADLALVEELAARAALAIDNARLYQEARDAVRARDDVLRVVSHDLGNPLSAVFVALKLLRRQIPAEQWGDGPRQAIDVIRRSARQLRRLVDDLLDVQRIESGRLSIEPAALSLRTAVDRAVRTLEPLAAGKSITLAASVPDDAPAVHADGDRVLQVFQNLVGNAVKFTPRGGRIEISVESSADGRQATVVVADTGPGIAPEDLPHVFDRFWQAERHGRHGTGLGLSIAKGIVEAHGGEIRVDSDEGEGTAFRFSLPVVAAS